LSARKAAGIRDAERAMLEASWSSPTSCGLNPMCLRYGCIKTFIIPFPRAKKKPSKSNAVTFLPRFFVLSNIRFQDMIKTTDI